MKRTLVIVGLLAAVALARPAAAGTSFSFSLALPGFGLFIHDPPPVYYAPPVYYRPPVVYYPPVYYRTYHPVHRYHPGRGHHHGWHKHRKHR